MPLFDYKCYECNTTFEYLVWHNSKKEIRCPSCGSNVLTKLLPRNIGATYVGDGFFSTQDSEKKKRDESVW